MASDLSEALRERTRRRRYEAAFKRALVEQTLAPGASVAGIAREHGINANQLFTWRRQLLPARQNDKPPVSLVPVTVVAEPPTPSLVASAATGEGQIEVTLPGYEIRIRGAVDAATLHVVLSSLRR